MVKRLLVGIVGLVAVVGSLLPLGSALEILNDIKNHESPFWSNILGEILACWIAFMGLWIGARFLAFAFSGRTRQDTGWVTPVLLGIASFLPGFVFSLPLTMLLAHFTRPGNDEFDIIALITSCFIGVAAAILCGGILLKKRRSRQVPAPASALR